MKKIAIMQPYLFPYIGYFQLIGAVDEFVILDNVQYINRGWINRNRILVHDKDSLFTFSLEKGAREKNINERFFAAGFAREKEKFLETLRHAYAKAPMYEGAIKAVGQSLAFDIKENIAKNIAFSLRTICGYLEIKTEFKTASDIFPQKSGHKADYLIDICRALRADIYINPPGGQALYDKAYFAAKGAELLFLRVGDVAYRQFAENFTPNLSVVDAMMFNSKEKLRLLLGRHDLL